jgi:hypothetical protein
VPHRHALDASANWLRGNRSLSTGVRNAQPGFTEFVRRVACQYRRFCSVLPPSAYDAPPAARSWAPSTKHLQWFDRRALHTAATEITCPPSASRDGDAPWRSRTCIVLMTSSDVTSITDMSFDSPLVVRRYFSSGVTSSL